ncbi:hypothetical protein [Acinetobacter nectaris]|uniref:hypothetical protein n=1 Tax=Acinetobacter nectaris TaxID=1219382 RepID=UPI001F25AD53|nr:hypothetical protein [Acinetobacter nectaris]MCF9045511.1 hypothetical protein [Acinetobacter nectaris]
MWKKVRVFILLLVLGYVAIEAWKDLNQNWDQSIVVLVHPINADGSQNTENYIRQLSAQSFTEASEYLTASAKNYHKNTSFIFKIGREIKTLPPALPEHGSILNAILWSLKFRYYAWKETQSVDGYATVTLYLNYYDSNKYKVLKHSTALERGRISVVNLFADIRQNQQNQVVMTHELLHAFGATDKYDLSTGQPLYPQGYVNPNQQPKLPQHQAELMAGYIPITETKSKIPLNLQQTVIGNLTAHEIGWSQ